MSSTRRVHVESRNRRLCRSKLSRKHNMKRLRVEMAEIRIDQKRIRKGQTEIREKLGRIEEQCGRLREETELIAKQKARSQLLLNLAVRTFKARQAGDFATAISLSRIIREVIQKERNK